MVDKRLIAESIITHGLNPYNSETELSDNEVDDIVDIAFKEWGFQDSSALIFHGGPSQRDEETRFEVFEETASYLEENGKDFELYFPDDKQYLLENSSLSTENINFISPEITEDDISMSGHHESRIHVTSDYYAERVDRLLNEYEEDQDHDYLVLGAYTGNLDSVTDADIGGVNIPITHEIAEGNEVRRKLQGSRF